MTAVVIDSSALVAVLVDAGEAGEWVARSTADHLLAAPDLVLFEAANVLRRLERNGTLPPSEAVLAHADLLALPLQLWPYAVLGPRVWELRGNFTAYHAAYVALAELLDAPLLSLDARMARAAGSRHDIRTPPTRE